MKKYVFLFFIYFCYSCVDKDYQKSHEERIRDLVFSQNYKATIDYIEGHNIETRNCYVIKWYIFSLFYYEELEKIKLLEPKINQISKSNSICAKQDLIEMNYILTNI